MSRENFIQTIAPFITKYAKQYHILCPSCVIAQAVLESDGGTSELAVNAHNYFGLKYRANRCPSACGVYYKVGSEQNKDGSYTSSAMQWMKFSDMDNGVKGYFDFINISNYSNLKGVTEPRTYLENIKKDGYATSLNYVQNLMNVINKYDLTKYDTQTDIMKPVNLNIQTLLANSANYGGTRNASSIMYLIYHYTANKTDKAKSNATYFKNNIIKASAHYFVDENDIYQSVEDLKIAYSVGGAKWADCSSTGGGTMYGKITNTNSISIEMCSTNGVISEATTQNAVKLGKEIMIKYNIPISNVYRHFDVNGKHCPGWDGWYGNNSSKWIDFKNKLSGTLSNISTNSSTSMNTTNTTTSTASSASVSKLKVTSNVKSIQTWLNKYYKTGLVLDGIYGTKTKIALIKAWQTEVGGLAIDGIFGTKSKTVAATHAIKKGFTSILVTIWQAYLVCNGYRPNGIDGSFGNRCYTATVAFQKNHGLTPDGVVGVNTWTKAFT